MSEFRNVSAHAQPLASGRLVAPGATAKLDLDDPHEKALAGPGGSFVPVETGKTKNAEKES